MSETDKPRRRGPRVLSPQTKCEIFLQVTSGETTQADAARKRQVDLSTVIGIRRIVKDAARATLTVRPSRRAKERAWELERTRAEIGQLTEVINSQAIELAIVRGRAAWSDVLAWAS